MEASAWRAPAGLGRRPAPILLRLRSDDQLVALFRLGNEEAFGVIHERYRARLLAYARQMLGGSRADAEDALQDVFIRAYHALRADDRPVTLRAWLYRVAHNRCIDQLRRVGGMNVVELFDNVCALDDPLAAVQRRDDLRRLIADVRRLPEQQRSALLMREMDGLSYAELADALEVTVPAVKSLLVRARMGLVEAQTARDTACVDIRADLAGAHDRGVRASGRARRHLRECSSCRDYRAGLRGVERGIAALAPSPGPWGALAKAFGISGSGAAAGGATAGGGSALLGGAATATTAKVAAVVCCAALVGGGAVKVTEGDRDAGSAAAATHAAAAHKPRVSAAPVQRPTSAVAARRASGPRAVAKPAARHAARVHRAEIAPAVAGTHDYVGATDGDPVLASAQETTGGMLGPEDDAPADDPTTTPTSTTPAPTDTTTVETPTTPVVTPNSGAAPAQGPGGAAPPTP